MNIYIKYKYIQIYIKNLSNIINCIIYDNLRLDIRLLGHLLYTDKDITQKILFNS